MKTNLDLVKDCDRVPEKPELLYKFLISGYEGTFGHLLETTAQAVKWGEHWEVDHDRRTLKLLGADLEERNKRFHETLVAERDKGTFKLLKIWTGEIFPVYGPGKELVLSVERIAAPLFGVLTYGIQLLAYQDNPEGPSVWVARRASWKRTFPNMLDSTVGGSLPTGESPFECLLRESEEEVSFKPELVRDNAVACGTINYVSITDERSKGEQGLLCPEVQFCYEMKIPKDVIPIPGDHEAQEVILLNIEQLKAALANGEFTPANGCVVLDFFIRHGILNFENEPNYITIASRLHKLLDLQSV
ncbi:Uncharacterized protein LAWI1_G005242 [Lachnellula willkommii]|uniref:Nudix hydrolase domain-containing protein n=1 Tax=Lachnellula willkommii TaxID=215461 RepID=A0A559M4S9_9HELO|nr:Uncharacterized protein LAWI1_G005242 [Lachnellula willkommii]